MMLKTYYGPLPIKSRMYVLHSGAFRSGHLSVTPSREAELEVRNTIHLYKDSMRKYMIEYGDIIVFAPTYQEMQIAECVAAYSSANMNEVARIYGRQEERHKRKLYHRNYRQYIVQVYLRRHLRGIIILRKVYVV